MHTDCQKMVIIIILWCMGMGELIAATYVFHVQENNNCNNYELQNDMKTSNQSRSTSHTVTLVRFKTVKRVIAFLLNTVENL